MRSSRVTQGGSIAGCKPLPQLHRHSTFIFEWFSSSAKRTRALLPHRCLRPSALPSCSSRVSRPFAQPPRRDGALRPLKSDRSSTGLTCSAALHTRRDLAASIETHTASAAKAQRTIEQLQDEFAPARAASRHGRQPPAQRYEYSLQKNLRGCVRPGTQIEHSAQRGLFCVAGRVGCRPPAADPAFPPHDETSCG